MNKQELYHLNDLALEIGLFLEDEGDYDSLDDKAEQRFTARYSEFKERYEKDVDLLGKYAGATESKSDLAASVHTRFDVYSDVISGEYEDTTRQTVKAMDD